MLRALQQNNHQFLDYNVQPLAIKSDTFNFTIDLSVELESAKKEMTTLYL